MPIANPRTPKSKTGLVPAQAIAAFCLMLAIGDSAWSTTLRIGDLPQRLVAELASGTVSAEVVDAFAVEKDLAIVRPIERSQKVQ